ncbi:4-carboxy-4-hydroxy-2-oxoadipate aldolase/oxaloacetate decarboxylase [bacterium]|nr:MAG: 4-carboxy-4-hydroxy-2-oxoadipate aldolase/oxaloacetate decarboxylase [bacterium]
MSTLMPDEYRRFAEYGVSTVLEGNGRTGLIDAPLIQLCPGTRAAGPARTVLCGQGDNLMVHAALKELEAGEILVLSMPLPEAVALMGELMVRQARARGAAGILVDGAVRDVEELQSLGVPVWARFIRARTATKRHIGAVNVPVTVGSCLIQPGDVVVLDADGGVAVEAAKAQPVLQACGEREQREQRVRAEIERGGFTFDLYGMQAVFDRLP